MNTGKIEVLYFAEAARRVGARRETIPLESISTLEELQRVLFRRHRELVELQPHLLWSVDEEPASPSTTLSGARTVAVLPPYSGG